MGLILVYDEEILVQILQYELIHWQIILHDTLMLQADHGLLVLILQGMQIPQMVQNLSIIILMDTIIRHMVGDLFIIIQQVLTMLLWENLLD